MAAAALGSAAHSALVAFRQCLGCVMRFSPPDPGDEVTDLLVSLQMKQQHFHQIYAVFMQMKQHDSLTVKSGPDEVSVTSLARLVPHRREWVAHILRTLIELGGFVNTVTWPGFLHILINFCMLSKMELCQVTFFIIVKAMRSWTVRHLTCAQLQEFYDFFAACPIRSFNTRHIQFDSLPLSKYSIVDFVDLVQRHGVLINPCVHLQRALQQTLPHMSFWEDYDRVRVHNRKITVDFFTVSSVLSFHDVVRQSQGKHLVGDGAAIAHAKALQRLEREEFLRHGGDPALEHDALVPTGATALPPEAAPQHVGHRGGPRHPVWLDQIAKRNMDVVSGEPLGTAALPEDPVAAERQQRLAAPGGRDLNLEEIRRAMLATTSAAAAQMGNASQAEEQKTHEAAERVRFSVRSRQLDLVRRSRSVVPKQDNIVSVMARHAQCELISRPAKPARASRV